MVRSVTGAMCSLFLPDEDRVVNMTADQLEPVQPQRGDSVKVILGQSGVGLGASRDGVGQKMTRGRTKLHLPSNVFIDMLLVN